MVNCDDGEPPACGDAVGAEHHLVHHPIVDGGEELLFRTDVVVERALAEIVGGTELGDAGGVVAAAGEHGRGRVDDGLATRLPLRAASGLAARCSHRHGIRRYSGTHQRPFHRGGSLLDERGRALLEVLGGEHLPQPLVGVPSQGVVVEGRGREHDLPAGPHRERTRRRDLSRQPERFVAGGARLDEPAHQPEIEGAARLDRLAGEDRVHRRGRPDGAGEPEQSAGAGDEVAGHLREPERRSGRRHDDVGGEDDLEPACGREPVDRDDHRLRALAVDEPGEPAAVGRERRGVTRSAITLRSAPAQKTGRSWPAVLAQSTPTQTSGSSSIWSTAASSPSATSRLTALRASGRLRVMTPIRSADVYSTASDMECSRVTSSAHRTLEAHSIE